MLFEWWTRHNAPKAGPGQNLEREKEHENVSATSKIQPWKKKKAADKACNVETVSNREGQFSKQTN